MKKTVATKWIKALRSGKFKKGKSLLKYYNTMNEPRHCCLGVLCELYNETMKKNKKKMLSIKTPYKAVFFNGKEEFLPSVVRKWAGMKTCNGQFSKSSQSLAVLNDTGRSFEYISKTIENKVEIL
jgi:hypothetical protein